MCNVFEGLGFAVMGREALETVFIVEAACN